jgi:UDP:flavonoid glycosyltransferase YjiC (YdhE family)
MPMGRDQGDIAARLEACGAGLILAPTAAETEIGAVISRLIEEPQFRAAARPLGDIIAAEVSKTRLVTSWNT